jgi:hypothetical protein
MAADTARPASLAPLTRIEAVTPWCAPEHEGRTNVAQDRLASGNDAAKFVTAQYPVRGP